MRLKVAAAALAIIGVLSLLAVPADAQTTKKKRTVYSNRGDTVLVTRDEDGRTRTRIIVQRRSYLDPGTERFPGERGSHYDYAVMPNQHATGVLDNTVFGGNQSALPNLWTLPGKNNPYLQY